MGVRLEVVIDAVTYAWRNEGVTAFQASFETFLVARELGYPRVAETGIWACDIPAMLSRIAAKLREHATN